MKNLLKSDFWIKFFATGFFGSYLMPFLPAVWGVILGLGVVYFINSWLFVFKLILFLVLTIFAIPLSTKAEKILNKGIDPQLIVIDEVCAMIFLSLFFNFFQTINFFGFSLPLFLIIIGIFGIFDGAEFFPIKQIERLKGGWGIVLDDLMASIYTIIVLLIFKFLIF